MYSSIIAPPTITEPLGLTFIATDGTPAELRCQYPSKRCDNLRTTKRGGGLHRLCEFHRERANKNRWLVDQRRRIRREREGTLIRRSPSTSPIARRRRRQAEPVAFAIDLLPSDEQCILADEDLSILHALLFDETLDGLDDSSDDCLTDASIEWMV